MPVMALSLRQPWAWATLHAGKTIENRSDRRGVVPPIVTYRGPLLLHAAKEHADEADFDLLASILQAWKERFDRKLAVEPPTLPPRDDLPVGVVFAKARAVGTIYPAAKDEPEDEWWESRRVVIDPGARSCVHIMRLPWQWWFRGHALVLDMIEPTPLIPCRGSQGLWPPPTAVLAQLGMR